MTNEEFSNEFDVLYNSYNNQITDGTTPKDALNEYEKSVFLTLAGEAIIKSYYNDSAYSYFEKSEEHREYLSSLVKEIEAEKTDISTKHFGNKTYIVNHYNTPKDLMFIIYEEASPLDSPCNEGFYQRVFPIKHEELYKALENPFRGVSNNRVLRLNYNNKIELLAKNNILSYKIRYVSLPNPIILVDLPQGISINGKSEVSETNINPILHKEIVIRAVALAIANKKQNNNNNSN